MRRKSGDQGFYKKPYPMPRQWCPRGTLVPGHHCTCEGAKVPGGCPCTRHICDKENGRKRRKIEGKGGRKGKEKEEKGVGKLLNMTKVQGDTDDACDMTLT